MVRLVPFGHWGGERAGVATTVDPRGIGWAINIGVDLEEATSSKLSLPIFSVGLIFLDGNGPNDLIRDIYLIWY